MSGTDPRRAVAPGKAEGDDNSSTGEYTPWGTTSRACPMACSRPAERCPFTCPSMPAVLRRVIVSRLGTIHRPLDHDSTRSACEKVEGLPAIVDVDQLSLRVRCAQCFPLGWSS